MKKLFPTLALVCITSFYAFGQNSVGINTSTPNSKAVLELVSPNNNQGFLVPRLTSGQRNAMTLGTTDRGMMVYDTNLNQFWHWDGAQWKAGLGVLGETAAGGDLEGIFPNPTIRDDAVGSAELTDVAGNVGTFGSSNDSTLLEVTIDVDGRVTGVTEKSIRIGSANILDASILNQDIATATITISRLDGEGNADKVLATDPGGIPYWEDRAAFASSVLADGSILIGSSSGLAEAQPVAGDLLVTNSGTEAEFTIANNAVNNAKVARTSLLPDRLLGPTTSAGRGLMVAQQSTVQINIPGFGLTDYYVPSFITTNSSSVLITDANGNISFEPRSSFELTTLAQGNVFTGSPSGTDQTNMNLDPTFGTILIGGTAGSGVVQARPMIGDIRILPTGVATIQDNSVQGDDMDATSGALDIAGIFPISLSTTSTSAQAIQLNTSAGGIDINGDQGVTIDATSGDVTITGQNFTNLLSNTDILMEANNDLDINTVLGIISMTSADALDLTGGATSSFTTTFGDIDINAAFQLDLDGVNVAMDATDVINITGGTNVTTTSTNGTATLSATNGEVDITAGTTVDINAQSGDVTIDAEGVGDDVIINADNQVSINGTSTQIASGTFQLNSGAAVDNITTTIGPAGDDNTIPTEKAVRDALTVSVSADNGLNESTEGNVQLGGDLTVASTTITQGAGEALTFSNEGDANTTISLLNSGDFVVDGQTGDVVVDETGLLTLQNGITVASGTVELGADAIQTPEISDDAITTDKLGTAGAPDGNKVYITDPSGVPFLEDLSVFGTTTLSLGEVYIGTGGGAATTLDASGNGFFLVGDGTTINSVDVGGDIDISSTGDAQIQTGAVTTAEIFDGTISTVDIATGAVTTNEIANATIATGDIANDAITSVLIANDAVGTSEIVDDAVTTDKLGTGGGTDANKVYTTDPTGNPQLEDRANFATSLLPEGNIFIGNAGSIATPTDVSSTSGQMLIADGTTLNNVTISGDININSAGVVQIAPGAVTTTEIFDGTISTADIATGAVTSSEIANATIATGDIANDAITSTLIADNAVGSTEIAAGAVTSSEILNATIATEDIADEAVTSSKIQDGTVGTIDVSDNAITTDKLGTAGGGDANKVFTTDGAGDPQLENRSNFTSSVLLEGSIYIGNGTNVATGVDVKSNGFMLVGNGTTVNSVDISGDVDINSSGVVQILSDVITAAEIATGAVGSDEVIDNSLTAADIGTSAITTDEILNGTILTGDIANDAITAPLIATDAVGTSEISANAVTADEIATGAVTTLEILNGTVATADIEDEAITAAKIANDAVAAAEVADDAIGTGEILDGAVGSADLADGGVATIDIADDAVTVSKLGTSGPGDANQVYTTDGAGNPQLEARTNFASSTLPNSQIYVGDVSNTAVGRTMSGDATIANDGTLTISGDAVESAEIVDRSIAAIDVGVNVISATEIATSAVTTDEILNGTIATADIANDAITSSLIADDAVGNTEIATDAVGSDEIAADAVTASEIATGAVTTDEILNGTIATIDLGDDAVTTDKLGTAGAGDANRVFTTDGAGNPQLEDRTNFASSTLNEGNIYIGDAGNVASGVDVSADGQMLIGDGTTLNSVDISGDIDIDNTGDAQIQADAVTAAEIATGAVETDEILDGTIATVDIANDAITSTLIADDAVGNTEIATNAVDSDEIAADAVTASEIATGAVTTDEILNGTIATIDLGDDAVTTDKLGTAGAGDANRVFTTDGAGNPQLEDRTNFASSTLNEGNIYIGDAGNVASGVDVSADGQMLIGDGTTLNSVDISGDIDIDNTGDAQIQADAVTAAEIATGAVETDEILDGTIATVDIANDAITSTLIADDAVGNTEIATNAVDSDEIAADAVTASEIATGAVTTDEILNGTIATIDLGDDAVTTDKLGTAGAGDANRVFTTDGAGNPQLEDRTNFASSTLNEGNIYIGDAGNVASGVDVSADGQMLIGDGTTLNSVDISGDIDIDNTGDAQIQADAVTAAEIATGAVETDEILDGTIATVDIANDAITSTLIADDAVGNTEIATNAVDSDEIAADAVTASEIATGAVTTDEILNGTIATIDLGDDAVTTDKLGTAGAGDANRVFTTDGAGNPQLEDRTNFASSTLNEGNIYIGDAGNVASGVDVSADGQMLIGDGTTLNSVDISGDIDIDNTGDAQIQADAVTAAEIATGAVETDEILDGTIATVDIANDAITSTLIADDAVGNTEIATNAVDSDEIAADAVTASEIATGAVTTDEILNGTIATIDLGDDAVTTDKLGTAGAGDANRVFTTDGAGNPQLEDRTNFASSTLNEGNIYIGDAGNVASGVDVSADGQMLIGDGTTLNSVDISGDIDIDNTGDAQIQADAVTAAEIATGAVETDEILDGTIATVDIANDAITSTLIADDAVGNTEIATNAVDSDEIAADAVTASEIATGAVTTDEILNGTIATIDLGDDAVTTDKLGTAGAGDANRVFTTDGAGNPQLEDRTNFASSTLNEGNIYIGDAGNVASGVDVSADGQMLIGDGTTLNSVDISGDIDIDNTGDAQIQADAVTAAEIATGAVETDEILDGTIATVDIANDAITSTLIADDAVGNTEIATNAVDSDEIAADAVTASEIATGAVTTDEILNGTIATIDLGDDAVTTDKLGTAGAGDANRVFTTDGAGNPQLEDRTNFASSTLNEGNIYIGDAGNVASGVDVSADGQMLIGDGTTLNSVDISGDIDIDNTGDAQIQADAVTAAEIATGAVETDEILDGTIATVDIANDAITSTLIADDAVGNTEIATNAVDSDEIAADAVTASEIATGAVTTDEILNGTIATIDLGDDAVTTDKLGTAGAGDANRVFTTDGAGNPQLEDRTNFASSTLNEGNIYIGDAGNVASGVDVSADGQMLIGDGTTLNSVDISGDIDIDNTGDAQIQADAVTAAEIATGAVETDEILDGTIATVDIANDAITSTLIADDAVGNTEIATNAVDSDEIAADAVTALKINADVAGAGLTQNITTGALEADLGGLGGDGVSDLGSNGDLDLDINGLANSVGAVEDIDLLAIYDNSGALVGKMTRANFIESATLDNIDISGGTIGSGTTIDKDPVVDFNSGDVQGSLTLNNLGNGSGSLTIQANSVDEANLNTSVAGNGLTGGGGTPLAVGAGTGITVAANDISVNITGIGGEGISDIGTDGDLDLDINGLTSTIGSVQDADLLAVYDADGLLVGKMTRGNFIETAPINNINIDGGTIDATVINVDDDEFTLIDETSSFEADFELSGLTANQTYTLPDASGTILVSGTLTGNRAVVTDAGGNIVVSPVTDTEIQYLDITTPGTAQASSALVTDGSTNISGITNLGAAQVDGGNLRIAGNVVSSTNTNGNITFTPDGTGTVISSSSFQASNGISVTSGDITLAGAATVDGEDVSALGSEVDDLVLLSGVPVNSSDLGNFTGTIISDANTISGALQELETDLDAIQSLSGVLAEATDLGTFNETIISDNVDIKVALQELETSLAIGGSTDDQVASEVPFTPITGIPSNNVQDAFGDVLPLAGGAITGDLTIGDASSDVLTINSSFTIIDNFFRIVDDADATKQVGFFLGDLDPGVTNIYRFPNLSGVEDTLVATTGVTFQRAYRNNNTLLTRSGLGNFVIEGTEGIDLGADANNGAINIGTGAAARAISIGNTTGGTAVDISAGSGGVNLSAPLNNTSETTLSISGGMTMEPTNITVNNNNQTVTVDNRSFIVLDDNEGGNTDFTITDGIKDGQTLVLLLIGTDGTLTLNDGGNTRLDNDNDWDATQNGDSITLIWYSGFWNELNRSFK